VKKQSNSKVILIISAYHIISRFRLASSSKRLLNVEYSFICTTGFYEIIHKHSLMIVYFIRRNFSRYFCEFWPFSRKFLSRKFLQI